VVRDTDIAWLAGVFDGEGCVRVQRSKRRGGRCVFSIVLTLANTSTDLVDRYLTILRGLGLTPNVDLATKYTKRPIFYVKVARKNEALALARSLAPYATSKRSELRMAILYLERACESTHHTASPHDLEILGAITAVKHGGLVPSGVNHLLDN
jgi:hypothetical protein